MPGKYSWPIYIQQIGGEITWPLATTRNKKRAKLKTALKDTDMLIH
jgi:hypothetical protein